MRQSRNFLPISRVIMRWHVSIRSTLLLGVWFLQACDKAPRDVRTLVEANGRFLQPSDGRPFTGEVVEYYGDTAVMSWSGEVRKGLLHNTRVSYYRTGDTAEVATYNLGLLDGPYWFATADGCVRAAGAYTAAVDTSKRDGPWTIRWRCSPEGSERSEATAREFDVVASFRDGILHDSLLVSNRGERVLSAMFDTGFPTGTWTLKASNDLTIGQLLAELDQRLQFPRPRSVVPFIKPLSTIYEKLSEDGAGFVLGQNASANDELNLFFAVSPDFRATIDSVRMRFRSREAMFYVVGPVKGTVISYFASWYECLPAGHWQAYARGAGGESAFASRDFEIRYLPCALGLPSSAGGDTTRAVLRF